MKEFIVAGIVGLVGLGCITVDVVKSPSCLRCARKRARKKELRRMKTELARLRTERSRLGIELMDYLAKASMVGSARGIKEATCQHGPCSGYMRSNAVLELQKLRLLEVSKVYDDVENDIKSMEKEEMLEKEYSGIKNQGNHVTALVGLVLVGWAILSSLSLLAEQGTGFLSVANAKTTEITKMRTQAEVCSVVKEVVTVMESMCHDGFDSGAGNRTSATDACAFGLSLYDNHKNECKNVESMTLSWTPQIDTDVAEDPGSIFGFNIGVDADSKFIRDTSMVLLLIVLAISVLSLVLAISVHSLISKALMCHKREKV